MKFNNVIRQLQAVTNSLTENSCDNTTANLLVWNSDYLLSEGQVIIKKSIYRLPMGGELKKRIDYIRKPEKCQNPIFWAAEGQRLDEFRQKFGDKYMFVEDRNSFDYVYLRENLANVTRNSKMILRTTLSTRVVLFTYIGGTMENNQTVPIWEKYTLSIEEAAEYFRIGIHKLRNLANENKDADWLLWNANRAQIKRKKFEHYIDSINYI